MSVTDIDAVIRQWAVKQNRRVNGQQNRSSDSPNNTFEIDWSRVKFSTANTGFPKDQDKEGPQECRSHVVFSSKYENKTEEVQNHTFQMERTTDATVRTKVTQGFSRNGQVGIKIDVPDKIGKQTGSFGSEIDIVSEEDNTVTHKISWGLNSTVKALPKKKTMAELKITENEYECSFDSVVHIRGRILVHVNNGGATQIFENDLATLLGDARRKGIFQNSGVHIQGRKITWTVSGELKFKFGVSQDVKVWTEEINN